MAIPSTPFTPPLPLPFPVDANGKTTLHPPLSRVDRGSLATWIVATTFYLGTLAGDHSSDITMADMNKSSDQSILDTYGVLVLASRGKENMPSPSIIDRAKSVGDFLGILSKGSTWTRVAEFAIGGLLIAIGANAALKAATSQTRNPVTKGARQVVNPIGTAAKATGRATFLAVRKSEANKYAR
jgi:hypothetical protein